MNHIYHFIGLGGIGMSALARILMQRGASIQGSDAVFGALLEQLSKEGASVRVGHDPDWIREGMSVVYSSDIKPDNEELKKAVDLGLPIFHRAELLNWLMQNKRPLLVTGSHGKTTTASLLSWVLSDAGANPSFAVGGIVSQLNTNGQSGAGTWFVAEADESDGSFLKTAAFGGIVTNLDDEHRNFWKTGERLEEAFSQFLDAVQSNAHLFWCKDDIALRKVAKKGFSYGFSKDADLVIEFFEQTDKGIRIDIVFQGNNYRNIHLPLLGRHNALNAAAVFGLALQLKIGDLLIRKAFETFGGVKRRLEKKGCVHEVAFYDDYGHHPTEIAATLRGLRENIKERRLIVIFQAHRYTRVRDLFDRFPHCFSDADCVVLTDIYSAREEPIEGFSTEDLASKMAEALGDRLIYLPRAGLEDAVVDFLRPLDVVLTIGAGDVTFSCDKILNLWAKKSPVIRVALLFGGKSAEHEVSKASAKTIRRALDSSIYAVSSFQITRNGQWVVGDQAWQETIEKDPLSVKQKSIPPFVWEELEKADVCIPVFHGPQGEDGMIQGFLDTLQIPYVGCDYRSGAICMHKGWTKRVALMHGIQTASFFEIEYQNYQKDPQALTQRIEAELSFPVWIKPAHLGSSFGVGRADGPDQVDKLALEAFSYDDLVLIERHVEGRQIEFGIMGNDWIQTGPPCEILNEGQFVGYAGKYGPLAMPYAIPARISEQEAAIGKELAEKIYRAARCKGLARIDFFIDADGSYWLNEINPFPGCTDTSAFPKIWAERGMDMSQVCREWLILALHRSRQLDRVSRYGG